MAQQHGKSGQANSPWRPGLQIKRCRRRDGRQCIEPRIEPAGKDDRRRAFQHIYQEHHQRRPFPQGPQHVRCPGGFGAMLPDINALEQLPRQIARGRGTEEIGDRHSSRCARNHEMHLDARSALSGLKPLRSSWIRRRAFARSVAKAQSAVPTSLYRRQFSRWLPYPGPRVRLQGGTTNPGRFECPPLCIFRTQLSALSGAWKES